MTGKLTERGCYVDMLTFRRQFVLSYVLISYQLWQVQQERLGQSSQPNVTNPSLHVTQHLTNVFP